MQRLQPGMHVSLVRKPLNTLAENSKQRPTTERTPRQLVHSQFDAYGGLAKDGFVDNAALVIESHGPYSMIVLIPVRYPLTDRNRSAINKGRELLADALDPELLLLHINRLQKGEHVTRSDLRTAIEAEFGALPATYLVRDAFLYEEAVLNEALNHDVDHIVLSERRYSAWQQLVRETLDIDVDLETFLDAQLETTIHIISDSY